MRSFHGSWKSVSWTRLNGERGGVHFWRAFLLGGLGAAHRGKLLGSMGWIYLVNGNRFEKDDLWRRFTFVGALRVDGAGQFPHKGCGTAGTTWPWHRLQEGPGLSQCPGVQVTSTV